MSDNIQMVYPFEFNLRSIELLLRVGEKYPATGRNQPLVLEYRIFFSASIALAQLLWLLLFEISFFFF